MPNRRPWTPAELQHLLRDYPDTPTADLAERLGRTVAQVYNKAGALGLRKSQAYLDSPAACRLKRGNNVGQACRFKPGHRPHNAGKKGWTAGGRSVETRFKPGHLGGKARALYQPIGTERVTKDGYLQRKVNDDMPLHHRWQMVHRLVWEEHRGPVPKGHAIQFLNGDKQDCRIENLALVSRRDLMKQNTVHRLPKELAEVVQLKGAVTRQINKRMKR
jgi:hypothetical protein